MIMICPRGPTVRFALARGVATKIRTVDAPNPDAAYRRVPQRH
jgi:hypothetical protein